jgi:predicted type IV restriction endonuclease
MVQLLPATKVTLGILEEQFGLNFCGDVQAFPEWQVVGDLEPEAVATLARVKANYDYLLKEASVLEETVKLVVLSPLLDLAGFYQTPFRIRTEVEVAIATEDEDGLEVRGAIDALAVLEQLWVVVIEAKKSDFSLTKALPQTLSYMLASPNPVTFGLVTNGSEFVFVKVVRSGEAVQYSTSRVFSRFGPGNELEQVLLVLRGLGDRVSQSQCDRP